MSNHQGSGQIRVVVIWTDWYAYHVARMEGLLSNPELAGGVAGIELVGGIGVHSGLKFREEIPAHLPVHTLLPNNSWHEAGQIRLAFLLWKKLSALSPSAVMVPGYATLPAISAALWARLHRRTSILMTESSAHDHDRVSWKEKLKSGLIRALFNFAIAGGKAHLRYLERLDFPLDHVARYYDVVDNNSLAMQTAQLRQSRVRSIGLPQLPYFLYVGRLAPEKNIDGLLAAWLIYKAQGGRWPLVLVGDGPCASALRSQARSSHFASGVHFAGLRPSSELPLFYAFAGCFVLPSTREPWGLVVNEAMASGLPVLVSSRCGAAEDLVEEGRNGYTFDPGSPSQLAQHLSRISTLSSERLQMMSDNSRQLIAAYSPQNFGNEIASLLRMAGA